MAVGSTIAVSDTADSTVVGSAAVRTVSALALAPGAGFGEEVADEPARAEFVELMGGSAEETFRTLVQRRVIEVEFGGESHDKLALPVGTLPRGLGIRVVAVAVSSIVVSVGGVCDRGCFAVAVAGHEARLLDLAIDGILEQSIEAGGLVGKLG